MVARLVRSIPADGHIYRYLLFFGGVYLRCVRVCENARLFTLLLSLSLSLSPETCPFRRPRCCWSSSCLSLVTDERSIHHWGGGKRPSLPTPVQHHIGCIPFPLQQIRFPASDWPRTSTTRCTHLPCALLPCALQLCAPRKTSAHRARPTNLAPVLLGPRLFLSLSACYPRLELDRTITG